MDGPLMLQTLAEYWESLDRTTKIKYDPQDRRQQDLLALHIRFEQDDEFRAHICKIVINRLLRGYGALSLWESSYCKRTHRLRYGSVWSEVAPLLNLTYMRLLVDAFIMETGIEHDQLIKMRRDHPLPITGKDGSHDYTVLLSSYPSLEAFQPAEDLTFADIKANIARVTRSEFESYGSDLYQHRIQSNYCERDFRDFYLTELETGQEFLSPNAEPERVVIATEQDSRPLITDEIVSVVEKQVREWGPVAALLWACSRILPLGKEGSNNNALMRAFTGIDDYTQTEFNTYLITADRKLRLLDQCIKKEEFEELRQLKDDTL